MAMAMTLDNILSIIGRNGRRIITAIILFATLAFSFGIFSTFFSEGIPLWIYRLSLVFAGMWVWKSMI